MEKKKKVRLSDIAERLNISTVTVSKALANKDGVGDDLRKQIKDLADEMGYKFKKTANQSINSNITGNIGVLIPARYFSPDFSYYWFIFNHLSKELLNRNYYAIMELLSDEDEQNLVIPRMLQDKKIDGIIFLGQLSNNYIDAVHSRFDNFILLDFYNNNMNLDSVSNDNYYNSYILTNYVISQGHKKLRFVGNINATASIQDRYMGYQKALFENKIIDMKQLPINDRDEKGSSIPLEIPFDDMPTAFICNNDEVASDLIFLLEENGYKVPQDISVTGFDNYIRDTKLPQIPITTVYIKPENTASIAADLIIKKINGEPYAKGRHLVSGNLIIKSSVAVNTK